MNSIDMLEMICEKLGTTINDILPCAVSYGQKFDIIISLVGLAVLLIGIICAFIVHHYKDTYHIEAYMAALIFAIVCIPIGIVLIIGACVSLHMWSVYPDIKSLQDDSAMDWRITYAKC